MGSVFFENFLMISNVKTISFILIMFVFFLIIYKLKKRLSFNIRILLAMGFGLSLGFLIQHFSGYSSNPLDETFVRETTKWYGLIGGGFIDLTRMLVIPLVMVSIIHVIINMKKDTNLAKLTKITLITTMSMVAISAILGLVVGILFNLGVGMDVVSNNVQVKEVTPIVDTIRGLIPNNPVKSMVDLNIIALVIFAAFIGIAAKRMSKKYMDVIKPFFDLINALHKIIISIAMTIIKFMPFAVIPLLANTIAQRGISSILDVGKFIIAIYVASLLMFIIQILALLIFKINPVHYIKKSVSVMILAFTSRSSVGTLPATIQTLTTKLGVNDATANFVAGFGTTAGMQGCAGIFPALVIVFVCNTAGIPIDLTMIIMSIIVVSIGSLGIAGIPGTSTIAASVALSGVGLASSFSLISPILAIDPIIDMGRTLINVTGSMTNAIIVDKCLGTFNSESYKNNFIESAEK